MKDTLKSIVKSVKYGVGKVMGSLFALPRSFVYTEGQKKQGNGNRTLYIGNILLRCFITHPYFFYQKGS
jgi:hypothetical protein